MKEYAISEARVKKGKDDVKIEIATYKTPRKGRPYELALASLILKLFGCECISVARKNGRGRDLEIFGTKGDITTATIMLDYAFDVLDKLKKERKEKIKKGTTKLGDDTLKVHIHSFLTGVANEMTKTCKAIFERQSEEAGKQSEYGIVLVDRMKKSHAFMMDKHPNIGKGRSYSTKNSQAYRDGKTEGKKVGFNKQASGKKNTKALPAKKATKKAPPAKKKALKKAS